MLLRSIRSQLLALVIATVIPFTAMIGIGLWNQLRRDEAAAVQRSIDEARLLAVQVDDHIGNLENLMTGLSHAVSLNRSDTIVNDALLRRVRGELPAYVSHVFLFGLDGTGIGSSAEDGKQSLLADRSYFEQVLAGGRLGIGEVMRSSLDGRLVITVARPVVDQSGRVAAVLAVATLLERFQDALRVKDLPPGSVVSIMDQKGIVIARNIDGDTWIGRDMSGFRLVARHLAAKEVSEIAVWPDGVRRITGSATAHAAPWLVLVGLPTDVALAASLRRVAWSASLIAVLLAAIVGIAWMLSGRIVRPLRQLGRDASILAAGNLGHRSAVRTNDEVGALASNFNSMAKALERREREAIAASDELRHAKNTLAAVIDASPVAIACSDLNRNIVLWSRAAEQLYGYTAEEAIGSPVKIVPPGESAESLAMYERARGGTTFRDLHAKRKRKDGTLVDVRIAAAPMYNPDGSVRGVAWAHEDISDRIRAEEQLRRLAHFDQLTNLPNRLSLQKELGNLLAGDKNHEPVAIVLFDLDGFKDVNDTLGHSTGDKLLIEVGRRLLAIAEMRADVGLVSRLGGDEFVVVIPRCGDPRVASDIVDLLFARLAEPFAIDDHVLHIGASAGIAVSMNAETNVDELIANADLALYQAKSDGGRVCRYFIPVMRAQAQARRYLDGELRRAFAANEFELYYQPQVSLQNETVIGAEALIRWRHPARGILGPGAFIDTLAESAIAPDVGRWIIRTACRQAARWRAIGMPLSRIALNLFPAQARDPRLLADVEEALADCGLPAEALELEITENAALNCEDPTGPLQKLHERGVRLAFDDFGTGYASLSYLTRIPVSRIKIDRSFVARINHNGEDAAIVRSLIAMAHNLKLEVIAEGVETEAQAAFLLNEGCPQAQGFLYSKPLPPKTFEAYLSAHTVAADADRSGEALISRTPNRSARAALNRRAVPRT